MKDYFLGMDTDFGKYAWFHLFNLDVQFSNMPKKINYSIRYNLYLFDIRCPDIQIRKEYIK